MDTPLTCPSCGKPLAPNAPKGLCPECLMKGAFPTGTDTGVKSPRFVPPKIEELAAKFPQLEILEFIGQGGMGAVYKTRQKQLDRIVALKILPPQMASGPGFAERFTREVRALAKLNHPHIVTLYEFGQADRLFYFLMEFVDGINLQQLLQSGRIAPNEALAIVPQICDALQFAHQRGIVHRDIKPGNILLSKEGQVKIADFGVAKIVAEGLTETAAGKNAPAQPDELTEAGSVLGTPQYMAPEQVAHPFEVDHRADIYSLGVVFYQMLTGELPSGKFEAPSKKVVIDVRLDEVVLRALERKPELRFQQASALKTQVETIAVTGNAGHAPDSAPNKPSNAITSADLNKERWKVVAWGFVLAAACVEMGINITPLEYGWIVGIWGVLFFVISAPLALLGGDNLKKFKIAAQIVSVDGIGAASAGIWCACHTPMLPRAWLGAIITACLVGIVYCLYCLFRCEQLEALTVEPVKTAVWTKAKVAIVVGAGVLLAAGPAIKEITAYNADDSWQVPNLNARIVEKAPPQVRILPTKFPNSGGSASYTDYKFAALNHSVNDIVRVAYHMSSARVIFATPVPQGRYDYISNLPQDSREALQRELKKQFGLTGRLETRDRDVLLLKVQNPNAPGLTPANSGPVYLTEPMEHGQNHITCNDLPLAALQDSLERRFNEPVIDRTGLTNRFSYDLKWNEQDGLDAEGNALTYALRDQLGLDLVPSREPIQMLIVEKAP